MTSHTITGAAYLPNNTDPLLGTWKVHIYSDSGVALNGNGTWRGGSVMAVTDDDGVPPPVTLPDGWYTASFHTDLARTPHELVRVGPYNFHLTADCTWASIMTTPVVLPTDEDLALEVANALREANLALQSMAEWSYHQASPSSTWTLNHNLHRHLTPTVFLDSDPLTPVYTDVTISSSDQIVLTFPAPATGWAYLN